MAQKHRNLVCSRLRCFLRYVKSVEYLWLSVYDSTADACIGTYQRKRKGKRKFYFQTPNISPAKQPLKQQKIQLRKLLNWISMAE